MSLIPVANPGWPVEHAGRTWRVADPGPLFSARLAALLRMRAVAAARADEPRWRSAVDAAMKGERDPGTDAGRAALEGEEGTVLLYLALLSVRHPEITEADVRGMLATPATRAALADAVALAMRSAPEPTPFDRFNKPRPWPAIVAAVMRRFPGMAPGDVLALSYRQIVDLCAADNDAADEEAGAVEMEGGFAPDDPIFKNGK